MKTIYVIVKETRELHREFAITDEEYKRLVNDTSLVSAIGLEKFNNLMEEAKNHGRYNLGYSVIDECDGKTIISFDE